MTLVMRMRLWLARWLAREIGFSVVRTTPLGLLPSRVEAIAHRIRTSGHLAHRYHVRGLLERDVLALNDLVVRVDAETQPKEPGND